MTVTATGSSGEYNGTYLYIRCVSGAKEAGGASADVTDGASNNSLTPNDTNSLPFWALTVFGVEVTLAAEANNTILEQFEDAGNGNTFGAGDYTGTVTGGTPVTLGSTSESSNCSVAAYEIEPASGSGGTTPVIDSANSPAFASSTSADTITSAAFTPASGDVIVVMAGSSAFDATTPAMAITDTGGLTFTQRAAGVYGNFGGAWIFTATVPAAYTRTASLTVTPAFTTARARGRARTASLTVVPSFTAPASVSGALTRTAALTVVPSFTATRVRTVPPPGNLMLAFPF